MKDRRSPHRKVGLVLAGLGMLAAMGGNASAFGPSTLRASLEPTQQSVLGATVQSFALELGRPLPANATDRLAALSDSVGGAAAQLLSALLDCHRLSEGLVTGIDLSDPSGTVASGYRPLVRSCADTVDQGAASLERQLLSMSAEELSQIPSIDLWPVVRFDTEGTDDVYNNDYILIIDTGGNDSYFNNAGGNLIDLRFGPAGSTAPSIGEARGCQSIPGLARAECAVSAAALIDTSGDDQYGRLQTADEDAAFTGLTGTTQSCTTDMLVRRITTAGAGLAGVGLLADSAGDDVYLGKTISMGAGHVAGVGILRDRGQGSDRYSAIRTSQGLGLVEGYGLLWDEAGDDTYTYYMPGGDEVRPGGVISDRNVCDAAPRNIQGAGLIGGTGILEDEAGNDTYNAPTASQGYGSLGGTGIFWDCGGQDVFTGPAQRQNGQTVAPSDQSAGLFIDELQEGDSSTPDDSPGIEDEDLENECTGRSVKGNNQKSDQARSKKPSKAGESCPAGGESA